MKVTFLGTGTSQGVPVIACHCKICTSKDPHDNRLRSSIWLHEGDTDVVIDSGPDFRQQMLRAQVDHLNAIVYTHGHKDHTAGLDDVRAYNFFQHQDIDVYANSNTEEILRREFKYIFSDFRYPGIPEINMHHLEGQDIQIGALIFKTIKVMHYKLEVYGYRIGDFTYITDANYIAPEEIEKIKGSRILVLNALRYEKHISHFTLPEAIEVARTVGAEQTYFTHIGHQLGLHAEVEKTLPAGMHLAYDGLTLEI